MKPLYLTIALLATCAASTAHLSPPSQHVISHDGSFAFEKKDAFDLIRHKLAKAGIISEVIDDFVPKCFVAPVYGKKKAVLFGNKLKESKTKSKPQLKIVCPNMISTPGMTIALTDPDAPSRKNPKWSEMCHWIAIVSARRQASMATGMEFEIKDDVMKDVIDCIFSFLIPPYHTDSTDKPPGPPAKTGYHRYVFVLLEGVNTNLTAPEDRQHWGTGEQRHGVRDWAKNESLTIVGANWFVEKNKKQKKSNRARLLW